MLHLPDLSEALDNLRERISDVRYSYGNTITFTFDSTLYVGLLNGRNRDLVLGFGEELDRAVALRILLDNQIKRIYEMSNEVGLNNQQRAHLLQLYKEKLQQLGDDEFFNNFDEIREECYETLGILSEDKMRNLQIVRMCTCENTKLVVNSIPAEVDCSWCDAKAGDTHAMSCQYGERYKQAEEILAQSKGKKSQSPYSSRLAGLLACSCADLHEGQHPFYGSSISPEDLAIQISQAIQEVLTHKEEMQPSQPIPFYVDPVHSAASTLGRQGGKVKSESKSLSSRSNGKKGGRPKVNKSLDMDDI